MGSCEMPPYSPQRIARHFRQVRDGNSVAEQGRALERLVCYLFESVPGIEITLRNELNAFDTEEIDVAFWNNQIRTGLYFLPNVFLVECKNWSQPVGSQEVAYFVTRLNHRGCTYGILVATNGITGVPEDLTRANYEIAAALHDGFRVLVVTRADIEALRSTTQLATLLKRKICELTVCGTIFRDNAN